RSFCFAPETEVVSLGSIRDGKYLQRLPLLARAAAKVRRRLHGSGRNLLFFTTSPDTLALARFSGLRAGIHEVADIRTGEGFGRWFSWSERFLFSSVSSLILTSPYHYRDFYRPRKLIDAERVFIIENRVNPGLADRRPTAAPKTPERLRLGLIGLLRYSRPIEFLLRFISENPGRFTLDCHGVGSVTEAIVRNQGPDIRYHGPFRNPEDLASIYGNIDLNFVVYDASSPNVRLAIPNKLFESTFFGVPLLCARETALETEAKIWGVGSGISLIGYEAFARSLSGISVPLVETMKAACMRIPSERLLDRGELIVARAVERVLSDIYPA
ncbi:MAG TPA: hypothetical protein PK636_00030, partial [bacterium]|nr:hypothetical protein [bacterium]